VPVREHQLGRRLAVLFLSCFRPVFRFSIRILEDLARQRRLRTAKAATAASVLAYFWRAAHPCATSRLAVGANSRARGSRVLSEWRKRLAEPMSRMAGAGGDACSREAGDKRRDGRKTAEDRPKAKAESACSRPWPLTGVSG
jgi:hypothetical protein